MQKKTGWALFGAGVAAVAGTGGLWLAREKTAKRPEYREIEEDGEVAIRAYPDLTVAEVEIVATREAALKKGYMRLADYITAKHRDGERIAMTVPVLSDTAEAGRGWRTRFIMPPDREAVPDTAGGVAIATLPKRKIAAIRFSGRASEKQLRDKERELRAWLLQHAYRPDGPAEHAYYNSPMIPPPLRRNEIWIPLAV